MIIATGSGSRELRRASGDVLLDRVRFMQLGPMTFGEWLSMGRRNPASPLELLDEDLRRFQVRGGFPGLVNEPSEHEARARLRRLCEGRVIDGDLAPRLGIRNRVAFGHLWMHFAHNPGAILDWRKLPGEFGVARETFEAWVHALLQAEMIVEVLPSQASGLPLHGRKRYSRVYPVDHALSQAYGVSVDEGPGLEALVLRQLRQFVERRRVAGLATNLTFWRDDRLSGPNEIDFRLEGEDVSLLIEVKGTRSPTPAMVRRQAEIAARLDRPRAVLLHRGIDRTRTSITTRGTTVSVHLWPVPLFLLKMDTCRLDAPELWNGDTAA